MCPRSGPAGHRATFKARLWFMQERPARSGKPELFQPRVIRVLLRAWQGRFRLGWPMQTSGGLGKAFSSFSSASHLHSCHHPRGRNTSAHRPRRHQTPQPSCRTGLVAVLHRAVSDHAVGPRSLLEAVSENKCLFPCPEDTRVEQQLQARAVDGAVILTAMKISCSCSPAGSCTLFGDRLKWY